VIRLHVGELGQGGLRLAVSPLWETLASLLLFARQNGDPPWPYGEWARRVPRDAVDDDLLSHLRAAGPLAGRTWQLPVPITPGARITDEVRAMPVPHGDDEPDGFRHRLLYYWDRALAPYWSAIRAAVEDDLLTRAQVLAVRGPTDLLAGLGGRVRWDDRHLTVASHSKADLALEGRRLTLVPLIFGRAGGLHTDDPRHGVALSYQSSGAVLLGGTPTSDLAGRSSPARGDRLSMLVGHGRAKVIRAMTMPQTVSTAAAALGMAPSTVSEHLSTLLAAGVLRRQRSGRRVIYELDHTGEALLEYLNASS
jgi:DNA-binding transcriptional ArsR family regulator